MVVKLPEGVNVKRVSNPFRKVLGLMFKKEVDYALLMEFVEERKKVTLHSFFVFFDFHCVFLDQEKVIVDIKRDISPFTTGITSDKGVKYVLEVPTHLTDIHDWNVGDKVVLRS